MASTGAIITSTLQRPAVKPVSEGISLQVLSADLNTNEPITTFEQNNGHNNRSHKKQRYLWYSQKCFQAPFHPGINPVSSSHRKKWRKGCPTTLQHSCREVFKGTASGRSCLFRIVVRRGKPPVSGSRSICGLMVKIPYWRFVP